MTRAINDAGLALIKGAEGLRLVGYICPAGIATIGYGHTGPAAVVGKRITEDEAEELLHRDLDFAQGEVGRLVTVPLNDNQFAALVSFVFNLGTGSFQRSTLLRRLNEGDYACVPEQLARWNQGGGKVLPGLVVRRAAEGALWGKDAP